MYKRKTIDLWDIEGCYNMVWERLSTYVKKQDAIKDLYLYRENEAGLFRIRRYRERTQV